MRQDKNFKSRLERLEIFRNETTFSPWPVEASEKSSPHRFVRSVLCRGMVDVRPRPTEDCRRLQC